jgi:hypothetical protein
MRKSVHTFSLVASRGEKQKKKEKFTRRHHWSAGVVLRHVVVVERPTRHGEVMRARKNAPAAIRASARLDADKTPRPSTYSEKNPRGELRMVAA